MYIIVRFFCMYVCLCEWNVQIIKIAAQSEKKMEKEKKTHI